jgi:hypothetical protein
MVQELSGGEELDKNHVNRMSIEPVDIFLLIFEALFKLVIVCVCSDTGT